tara:strand:+ start:300 stop:467 length:168 start_codon:yes stop_codon:yes gene_type:complete
MALSPVATKRVFQDVWICMNCSAKNKGQKGKPAAKCRKCSSKRMRLKKKGKKKAG